MHDEGYVASVGNAGGNTYQGSVLPFIMQRAQLFGVAANAIWPQRVRLWDRLAGDLKPDFTKLMSHVHPMRLEDVLEHAALQLSNDIRNCPVLRQCASLQGVRPPFERPSLGVLALLLAVCASIALFAHLMTCSGIY